MPARAPPPACVIWAYVSTMHVYMQHAGEIVGLPVTCEIDCMQGNNSSIYPCPFRKFGDFQGSWGWKNHQVLGGWVVASVVSVQQSLLYSAQSALTIQKL